jgi:hypothetical protein
MRNQINGILRDRILAKGWIVAYVLNRVKGPPKRTLISLIEHYQNLERLLPKVVSAQRAWRIVSGPYEGAFSYPLSANKEAARSMKTINRLLSRHHFRRQVAGDVMVRSDMAPSIRTETYAAHGLKSGKKDTERGWTDDDEYDAVEKVTELAVAGELRRLRKCGFCFQWLMATRTDRVYHEECAAKQHRKQRADSGIRNEYMKWYRKYAPVSLQKRQLEEKRADGFHLTKAERDELRRVTEETERLKDQWKATLKKLKGGK